MDYSNNGYDSSGRLNASNESMNIPGASMMHIEDPDINTNYSSYVCINVLYLYSSMTDNEL